MLLLRAGLVYCCIAALTVAAEPVKVDVFAAGTDGYPIYRIPTLVMTGRGTLIAACEARQVAAGDWAEIDIVYRRSLDGGQTWEPMRVLEDGSNYQGQPNPVAKRQAIPGKPQLTCGNIVLIADDEQKLVHGLYTIENQNCFYVRSEDDGKTFSKPREITDTLLKFRPEYAWQVAAAGPGHSLVLKNGRLLVPFWMSNGQGAGGHRPSCVATIYSDDRGKTWERGEIVVNTPELKNPSETSAVELSDGRVLLNIRSENPEQRRAISISKDGATAWSKIKFDQQLYEPICMASILRLQDGKGILFANPNPLGLGEPEKSRKRANLTLKLSQDDAATWPVTKVLHAGPSAYSDLAQGKDGRVYCLYERDGNNIVCASFDLEWLTEANPK